MPAHELGADGAIGTRLAVSEEGTLTGRYEGRNCRGEEKVRRLREWIDGRGESPTRTGCGPTATVAVTCGMLAAADVGVNVGRLGPLGRLRSFPGLSAAGPAPAGLTGLPEATGPVAGHRYSFLRIHTSTNQPQMGGR